MRTILTAGLVLVAGFVAAQTGTHLRITLENYNQPKAVLAYHLGDQKYIKDTLQVQNGVIDKTYPEGLPGGVYLVVLEPSKQYFELLVNEPEIVVSADAKDPYSSVKVKTSEENLVFYDYLAFTQKTGKEAEPLNKEYLALKSKKDSVALSKKEEARMAEIEEKLKTAGEAVVAYRKNLMAEHGDLFAAKLLGMMVDVKAPPEIENSDDQLAKYVWYNRHYWDNVDLGDSRYLRTPVFQGKLDRYFQQYVVQVPDSIIEAADRIIEQTRADSAMFQYVLVKILNKYIESKIMCMESIYLHLINKYYLPKDPKIVWWIDDEQYEKFYERYHFMKWTECGDQAPEIALPDPDGNLHSLSSLENAYTILYFYDPNCGHCKKTTPQVRKVHDYFKDYGVDWYAVSTKEDVDEWEKFIRDYKMENAINVADIHRASRYKSYYDIQSTPVMIILDDQKKIIGKKLGPEQLGDFLGRLLGVEYTPQENDLGPTEQGNAEEVDDEKDMH